MKAYKTCYYCHDTKHISQFYSKDNQCKSCHNFIAKVHQELRRKFMSNLYVSNSQDICFICNERHKRLDLANLTHRYTLDLKDYMLLCSKCHILLDNLLKNRNNHKFIKE